MSLFGYFGGQIYNTWDIYEYTGGPSQCVWGYVHDPWVQITGDRVILDIWRA